MNELISTFLNKGYYLYSNKIENEYIEGSRNVFSKILNKSKNLQYKNLRIYDDYSSIPNLAGIENIFHETIIFQEIINIIEKSEVVSIAKKILDCNNLKIVLSRYHVNGKYTHVGQWHRDGNPNSLNGVQLNIYLFDECGFEIVKNSHKRFNTENENNILNKSLFMPLSDTEYLCAKSGDVLVFHPSLLHRGKVLKERAHIHLRFEKNEEEINFTKIQKLSHLNKYKISKELREVLENSSEEVLKENDFEFRNDIKSNFKRYLRLFIHKFLFFLPYNSYLYKKFQVSPCLKKRKILFK